MVIPASSGILQPATTVNAVRTAIGGVIPCGSYASMCLFFTYVNGDETQVDIAPFPSYDSGDDKVQWQSWTAAVGVKTSALNELRLTATGEYYIVFDITGIAFVRFEQQSLGGTPTGTLAVKYTLTEK
jgi:hypothetical protein